MVRSLPTHRSDSYSIHADVLLFKNKYFGHFHKRTRIYSLEPVRMAETRVSDCQRINYLTFVCCHLYVEIRNFPDPPTRIRSILFYSYRFIIMMFNFLYSLIHFGNIWCILHLSFIYYLIIFFNILKLESK